MLTDKCTRQCLGLPLFLAGPKVTSALIVESLDALLPPDLAFLIADRGTHFTAHDFARCADAHGFVHVLIARHEPGAGIGWHRDAPMFGSRIAGVSLLSPCRMRFQRTVKGERETAAIELAPRSAYVLGGKARWSWQHSIPATKALRYSITFRTLKRG